MFQLLILIIIVTLIAWGLLMLAKAGGGKFADKIEKVNQKLIKQSGQHQNPGEKGTEVKEKDLSERCENTTGNGEDNQSSQIQKETK